jgi:hypothetical protein
MTIVNAAFSTLCGRDERQRKAIVSNWKYEEVVPLTGLEPVTPIITNDVLYQLS